MTLPITPFEFESNTVRTVMRDGAPWFVLADVRRVLEIGNPSQAATRLDDDERHTLTTDEGDNFNGLGTLSGAMPVIITESGLYSLTLTSRKVSAKRFMWQAETDAAAAGVLRFHFPDVPNLGDMTRIAAMVRSGAVEAPDVLVGGTPCQSFSIAGLRGGMADARGSLSLAFVEIANAIDAVRRAAGHAPCWVLWENVPGVFSDDGNAFGCILGGLVGSPRAVPAGRDGGWDCAGVVDGPDRCAAWRVLDAQHFGVAQRRRRVFVLARGGAVRWSCADALQPLIEGVRWRSAPIRATGQETSHCITAGAGSGSGASRYDPSNENLIPMLSGTLDAASGQGRGAGTNTGMIVPTTASLTGSMGRRGGQPDGGDTDGHLIVGALGGASPGGGWRFGADEAAAGQLIARAAVGFQTRIARNGRGYSEDAMPALAGASAGATSDMRPCVAVSHATQYTVRRLMPIECERLQGFPDGWTCTPRPGGNASQADGPRYKQIGNSMAVPVLRYIGERIAAIHKSLGG